ILNPYHAFTKPHNSILKSIKSIIKPPTKKVKENVQATRFDQCHLLEQEQFVTLEIPEYLLKHISERYNHLHFGTVRLALTFHGRKGLPIASRIALLDTRFLDYQHACIGTFETTLNVGTMFITLFPNFNMPLLDLYLLSALKVQIQIVGASQVNSTFVVTLHYQMVYRVQNHTLDLVVPQGTEDALIITINSTHVPSCIHIPKQISHYELIQLIPESWITNYENLHKVTTHVQAVELVYRKNKNGKVEIVFPKKPEEEEIVTQIFPTQYQLEPVRVTSIDYQGKPIYEFTDSDGHKYWDICDCPKCVYDDDEDDCPSSRRKKIFLRYNPLKILIIRFSIKILNPTSRNPDGTTTSIFQAETVMNWQSENAVHQNYILQRI
ncbi:LOW QUALITY PROTEIN: MP domain-containing protein, partial [Cephalotus follicularis]